jgi:flagellar basal body-associated protein FliL
MADAENPGADSGPLISADQGVATNATTSAADADGKEDERPTTAAKVPRRVSLSIRTVAVGGLVVALAAGVAVISWLYLGERSVVDAERQKESNYQRAEQISLDYAVNAATMNYQDLNTWKGKLVAGTTPTLTDKLTKAATSMQQLLVPLEWTSTAQPLVAKVRSDANGIYVVDTFVSVLTTTTQAPDNLQSTATYSITIDHSNGGWQISDVGGITAVVPPK